MCDYVLGMRFFHAGQSGQELRYMSDWSGIVHVQATAATCFWDLKAIVYARYRRLYADQIRDSHRATPTAPSDF